MKKFNGLWLSAIAFVILLVSTLYFLAKHSEVVREARALCLDKTPLVIAHRHIQMLKELPERPLRDDMFPVHIMYRRDKNSRWQMAGTGTYLRNFTPSIITAYHLFNGHHGEFGYRKMSKQVFAKKEPVFPILRVTDPLSDDLVLCGTSEGNEFPHIALPERKPWILGNKKLKLQRAGGKVSLFTRPQKPRPLLYWTDIKPGIRYFLFEGGAVAGESGTGGLVDTEGRNSLLVVLQTLGNLHFEAPAPALDPKSFGVGALINFGITPPPK